MSGRTERGLNGGYSNDYARETELEEGIPAGLPYLTGWAQHFAVVASMAESE